MQKWELQDMRWFRKLLVWGERLKRRSTDLELQTTNNTQMPLMCFSKGLLKWFSDIKAHSTHSVFGGTKSTFSLLVNNFIYSFDSSDLISLIHHKTWQHRVAYHGKRDMTLWLIENSDIFQSMHHNWGRRRDIAVFPSLEKKTPTITKKKKNLQPNSSRQRGFSGLFGAKCCRATCLWGVKPGRSSHRWTHPSSGG